MPASPETTEALGLLRDLERASVEEAEAKLARLLELRLPDPSVLSPLHRILERHKEGWPAMIERVMVGAGYDTSTPALVDQLRGAQHAAGEHLLPSMAIAILGARPEAVEAARPLVHDMSGDWMAQQYRWADVARVAEALGPERGTPLLLELWNAKKGKEVYRDVHHFIGRCLHRWGEGALPFLLGRLEDDPRRMLIRLERIASTWGRLYPGIEARLRELGDDPAARRLLARLQLA